MGIDKQNSESWLRLMLRIRRMEEACAEQYSAGKIRGFLHLYIGEEAIATALASVMEADDRMLCTYREHGHALARGIPMQTIMAEMFGKITGCSRGRGGSMHLFSKSHRFYGGNAIVASHLPVAMGMALADKMQNRQHVTICVFGEGAMAEGEFHEAMNLAGIWKVPVVFVCENNLYAMGTALERSESQPDLCKKAQGYNVETISCDGMDVEDVFQAASRAIRDARELQKPVFLECKTYRFRAHSMFDAELYRDKQEVASWRERDPIELFRRKALASGVFSQSEADVFDREALDEVAKAVSFADASELEPVEELCRFVHSELESIDDS